MTKAIIAALALAASMAQAQPAKRTTHKAQKHKKAVENLDLKVRCQASWSGSALGTYQISAGFPMEQDLIVKGVQKEETFASGRRTAIYWSATGTFSGGDTNNSNERVVYILNVRKVIAQKGVVDANDFQPVGTMGAQLDVQGYSESVPMVNLGANRAVVLFEDKKPKDISVTAYNLSASQTMLNPPIETSLEASLPRLSNYVTDGVDVYCRVFTVAKNGKKRKSAPRVKKKPALETSQSGYGIF
jgi:hypothetical protein